MVHALAIAGTVLALGGFAVVSPAAASPYSFDHAPRLVIPAEDVEDEEVEHDLRPDVTPPPSATEKGEAEKGAMEAPKEGGSGDVEDEEVWQDLRPDVTAPPAAVDE
jgi:hypothetical protein